MADIHSDRRLVTRMLAGEEAAFNEFFDDFFPRLYRFTITRVDNDGDLAKEIVQRTICKAIDRLESYRGEAALFSWLCQICRNELANHFRDTTRRARIVIPIDEHPSVRGALESLEAGSDQEPQVAFRNQEVAKLVHVTLDYLPPRYARALEWKYVEGLSVKEIAARMNMGATATQSLLARARNAFRDGFAELFRASPAELLEDTSPRRGS